MELSHEEKILKIKSRLTTYPNFPKEGIMFCDVFPLAHHPSLIPMICELFASRFTSKNPGGKVDMVVGLDARGFLFGPELARILNADFVPARKAGKLPGKTVVEEYNLEYGTAVLEIQKDYLVPGKTAIVVDDLFATGGTMTAVYNLLTNASVQVLECMCVIELPSLNGRKKLPGSLYSLVDA